MIEVIVEKLQQKVEKHGERIAILEDTTIKNAELNAMRHAKLEIAVQDVINLSKQTNERLENLAADLREPIEEFRIRKFGLAYIKNFFGNIKYFVPMIIGAFAVLILMNLTTIIKLFELVK